MSDKLQMQSVRGFLTANSLQRLNCYREGCLCGESRAFSRDKIINAQLQILLSLFLRLRPYRLGNNQAQWRMQHHIFFWRQLEKVILIPCKLSGGRKCAGHSDPKAQWPFPSLLLTRQKSLTVWYLATTSACLGQSYLIILSITKDLYQLELLERNTTDCVA